MKPSTDLESFIEHLAGRQTLQPPDHADPRRPPRDDRPTDASRFFDEIRRRTRDLLDAPDDEPAPTARGAADPSRPTPDRPAAALRPSRPVPGWALLACFACSGLMIAQILDSRRADRQADERSRAQAEQILAAIRGGDPPRPPADAPDPDRPDPLATLADRLDASIAALGTKVDALARPAPRGDVAGLSTVAVATPAPAGIAAATVDLRLASLAADLAATRRELAGGEAATTRQIQELRTVLQEVNTVVRRVLSRPQAAPANNPALPLLVVTVQALINNLQNPSAQVRGEAVEQLVRIGSPARNAIPALQLRLNQESDSNVRTAIETAINVLSSN